MLALSPGTAVACKNSIRCDCRVKVQVSVLKIFFKIVFWFLVLAITVLALYPALQMPQVDTAEAGVAPDIVNHVIAFLVPTMLAGFLWRSIVLFGGSLATWAVALEIAQYVSPGREVHSEDAVASLVGVVAGCLVIVVIRIVGRSVGWPVWPDNVEPPIKPQKP